MQPSSHPETLGVFSPVGHVVISFPTARDMTGAVEELFRQGWTENEVIPYTPEKMKAQADIDLARASPLANLGQEVNLVRAHHELAERGYSFLVVHAPQKERAHQVAEIAKTFHAERAQKYGSFLIEELIESSGDEGQVFESPSRGLDAQTESGQEKDRSVR